MLQQQISLARCSRQHFISYTVSMRLRAIMAFQLNLPHGHTSDTPVTVYDQRCGLGSPGRPQSTH